LEVKSISAEHAAYILMAKEYKQETNRSREWGTGKV
jgi:hypothetical protein